MTLEQIVREQYAKTLFGSNESRYGLAAFSRGDTPRVPVLMAKSLAGECVRYELEAMGHDAPDNAAVLRAIEASRAQAYR